MSALIGDSIVYGGAWTAGVLREVFEEVPKTRAWLEILAVLAETQADVGLIPDAEARAVATTCRTIPVDDAFLREVRTGYEASGHSLVGLLDAVGRRCPDGSGEWLCYGATVQDVTDTWLMTALALARDSIGRDLTTIDSRLADLARAHRDTPMAGRTHGQVGLPITFGFKVAGWLAELRRHRRRLEELSPRMEIGQLAGGVGSLSSLGPRALEMQARFLGDMGLRAPDISWTSSRDVLAEWCGWLTLVTGTADRIGHEVYNLQRPEIGEVAEAQTEGTIGSITMPHKRNPEIAEHLGTLARVVRHNGAIVAEGLVGDHERDGRSWKAEWLAIPTATLAAGRAVELLVGLLERLVVDPARMRANLEAAGGAVASEAVMLALAPRTGRMTAHRIVHEATDAAARDGIPVRDAILASPAILAEIDRGQLEALLDGSETGWCAEMVDRVVGTT